MGGLVSEVGSLTGGGNNNSQFTASGANLLTPTTVDQANTAYSGVQGALGTQSNLASALQPGLTQGINSQSQLTTALQAQAAGGGPNPAQAALNQNTAANTANQAALMAGQRGAGANVGLMARQAAQTGAANQQGAVGQAATMQANQTLAAQQQLQSLAASQVGQSASATGANTQAQLGEQSNILGGINAQNSAQAQMQASENAANSGMAQTNANNAAKATGGLLNSAGQAAMMIGLSKGGEVPALPEHLMGVHQIYHGGNKKLDKVPEKDRFAEGGDADSADAIPTAIPNAADSKGGGMDPGALAALAAAKGGKVPGMPKVAHNDPENDVVPAMLTPGEDVLPLSVTQADDPGEAAKIFVNKLIEEHGKSLSKEHSDFHEALKTAISSRKKK